MRKTKIRLIAALSAALLLGTGLSALPAGAAQTWMTAYVNKLNTLKATSSNILYALADIDQDGVPEMITSEGPYHAYSSKVYTFNGKDLVELCYGGDYGRCTYQPDLKRVIETNSVTGGGEIIRVWTIVNHKAVNTATYSFYLYQDGTDEFFVDGKKTTYAAYEKAKYDNYLGTNTKYPCKTLEYKNMTVNTKLITMTTCMGDPNTDGRVDASDAAKVLMAAAKAGASGTDGLTPTTRDVSDLNGDSKENASDAALILGYAAKTGSGWVGTIGDYLSTR